ncbi:MAG: TIGR02099 family protein, partial [Candidatus Obscuribacterales bacterium]|nr:TIGR02099 family protein [Steroidobacteraceae bacterium]
EGSESRSSLTFDITSTDARTTLRALNYHDVITAARANVHADLSWPGGPDENLLGRSTGEFMIEMGDGQLLGVKPGAGRVLGLMSLSALPRRLSLDFRDLTDKGLAFDTVRGNFELKNGDAFTTNLVLRGPVAEIGIVGRTGLGTHDYDQTAVVTGDIGGSLGVAGAVVGGPVVGAALLVFSRIFKEPLKGVARAYYRISGPWDEPVVERIDKDDAQQSPSKSIAQDK